MTGDKMTISTSHEAPVLVTNVFMSDTLTRVGRYVIGTQRHVEIEHYPVISVDFGEDDERRPVRDVTIITGGVKTSLVQMMITYPETWCDDAFYIISLSGDPVITGREAFFPRVVDDMFSPGPWEFVKTSSPSDIHLHEVDVVTHLDASGTRCVTEILRDPR